MKTQQVEIAYATLKAVQNFFGTKKANYLKFPTESDIDYENSDDLLFLNTVAALPDAPVNKRKEHVLKPSFTFGRLIVKMSEKAATTCAIADCDMLIQTYLFDNRIGKSIDANQDDEQIKRLIAKGIIEVRVQVTIVSPAENNCETTIKSAKDFAALRTRPASATVADDTDDDVFDDDDK